MKTFYINSMLPEKKRFQSNKRKHYIFKWMSHVKMIQQIVLTTFGVLVTLENLIVVLAAFRNKFLRENTHCNLVVSLSVYDFVVGLTIILYGNMIMPNYDSNDENLYKVCAVYFCVTSWVYLTSLVQTFF